MTLLKHLLKHTSVSCILLIVLCLPADTTVCQAKAAPPYISPGNFYAPGPLKIQIISKTALDAPVPLDIYFPEEENSYPVIVFLPGFTASKDNYETILRHLASHGFIVAAAQMYRPDCYACAPPPALEAAKGLVLLRWIERYIDTVLPVTADTSRIGIAGHSRGGQIAFRIALNAVDTIAAVAGVDPVDGLEMFRQTKVTDRPWSLPTPAFVIGTGLGPVMPDNATFPLACAPADIGHEIFYTSCPGPAWHAVALDNGHADMIDEEDFVEGICPGGPDRNGMRSFTAGGLAAFFSGILQGSSQALPVLSDPDDAPVACTMETKGSL